MVARFAYKVIELETFIGRIIKSSGLYETYREKTEEFYL